MQRPWLDRLYRGSLLLTAFLYSAGYAAPGLLLVLITIILDGIVARRLPWRRTRMDLVLVLFVGIFLLSGYLAEFRPMAVASTGLAALTIYLAFGGVSRVMPDDRWVVPMLVWSWVVGGGLTAIWAILRHFQSGTAATIPGMGQNALGTTMIVATVFSLGLAFISQRTVRYLPATVTILGSVTLLFSYSRGAWLGTLVAMVILAVFGGRKGAAAAVAVVLLIVLGVAITARGERVALGARARSILISQTNQDRIYLLRAGIGMVRDHPLLGTGLNTFPYMYARYRLPGDPRLPDARPNAHNIFLNMAAEGGLLGLGAFLAILAAAFRLGLRWRRAVTGDERVLSTAVLAALIGILVQQAFDGTVLSFHIGAGMWMLIGIIANGHRGDA